MKKTVFRHYRFAPVLLLTVGLSSLAMAQKTKSTAPKSANQEVTVRIIERDGADVRETERTYRIDGMNNPDRDKLVTKLVDSLRANRKGTGNRRQMTIIVEDTDGDRIITRERTSPGNDQAPGDVYVRRGRQPRTGRESWDNQTWHE